MVCIFRKKIKKIRQPVHPEPFVGETDVGFLGELREWFRSLKVFVAERNAEELRPRQGIVGRFPPVGQPLRLNEPRSQTESNPSPFGPCSKGCTNVSYF